MCIPYEQLCRWITSNLSTHITMTAAYRQLELKGVLQMSESTTKSWLLDSLLTSRAINEFATFCSSRSASRCSNRPRDIGAFVKVGQSQIHSTTCWKCGSRFSYSCILCNPSAYARQCSHHDICLALTDHTSCWVHYFLLSELIEVQQHGSH